MDTLVLAARVTLSLAVVLGVLWFLQRRVTRSTRVKRAASAVTVVTRQGIAPKASVVVVDVEGSRYLLGVTEQSVTLLSSGQAPVSPAVLSAVPSPSPRSESSPVTEAAVPASAGAFAQVLEAEGVSAAIGTTTPRTAPASAASVTSGDAEAEDVVLRRPRDRASRLGRPVTATSPLAGSILSGDTWRQAGLALRQRRAG
ncbi:FliO/MopB family protein [Planctomonas deserti]|uniref:FliO/MopB family protein n=1 Tax=Planctomonas deserti TaxID=2144185 RepID=UPI000D36B2EC|nr:flagellar biosynthetic protein FliO [Planctomonas deserti]